ncbi:MAG: hypothetical protein WBC74_04570 [Candidatus Omnitrophota bacterium]
MNKTVKKLIAREGLILIATIIVGGITFLTGLFLSYNSKSESLGINIGISGIFIGIIYLAYITIRYIIIGLLIRFILWAIRALKEK